MRTFKKLHDVMQAAGMDKTPKKVILKHLCSKTSKKVGAGMLFTLADNIQ